jgi:hypothetical protein
MEDLLIYQEKWVVVYPETILMGMSKEEWGKFDGKERSVI